MVKKKEISFRDKLRRIVLSHTQRERRTIDVELEDVLSFLKTAGMTPTPVQRFLLKLIYKLPLDNSTSDIEIWDRFKETLLDKITEVGFFHWLKENEQINLEDPDYHLRDDVNLWNINLPWGRRGSKTALAGFIAAFETYSLLHFWSPHDFFGVIDTEEIRVMSISTSKENAQFVRNYALACIDNHPFFEKYKLHDTKEKITFKTQKMIDRGLTDEDLKERPGVVLATYPANQRLVRGAGNIVIIYDELAHYIRLENSVTGDEKVVNAASPSQARFHKDNDDGRGDIMYSKTLMISDPLDEAGVFHREFERGMKYRDPNYLVVQLSTVIANPAAVTTEFLKKEYKTRGEKSFQASYEGLFTLGVTSFIESMKWIEDSFEPTRRFNFKSVRQVWYYCGVDLGFATDKTAISIVHRTNASEVIQDYLKVWWADDFADDNEKYSAILKVLEQIYYEYEPRKTVTDQWEGRGIIHAASRFGLTIDLLNITARLHSDMAKLFRTHLRAGTFKTSLEDGKSFRDELISLRKQEKGQDIIRVEKAYGSFDDEFDATIRSVWAASEESKTNRGLAQVELERGITAISTARQMRARSIPGQSTFRLRVQQNQRRNRWGQGGR